MVMLAMSMLMNRTARFGRTDHVLSVMVMLKPQCPVQRNLTRQRGYREGQQAHNLEQAMTHRENSIKDYGCGDGRDSWP